MVIAEAALWCWYFFLRRRGYRRKTPLLVAGALAVGAAMTVAANASWGLFVNLEVARNERLAAATQVLDMRDEMLLSPKGDPIGVRLRYTVRFPRSDYFWQSASLESGSRNAVGVWADGRRVSELIEPPMAAVANGVQRYERGKTYHFTTEFLPNFLM